MSELAQTVLWGLIFAVLWIVIGIRDLQGKDQLLPFSQKYADPAYRAMWQKKNGIWEIVNGIFFAVNILLTAFFPQLRTLRTVLLVIVLIGDIFYAIAFACWDQSDR